MQKLAYMKNIQHDSICIPGNFVLDDKQERTPGSTRATGRSGEYIGSASAVLQLQDPFVNENISGDTIYKIIFQYDVCHLSSGF